jgi:hypothetical protein
MLNARTAAAKLSRSVSPGMVKRFRRLGDVVGKFAMPFLGNDRRRLYGILDGLLSLYFERRRVAADAGRARQVEIKIRKLSAAKAKIGRWDTLGSA